MGPSRLREIFYDDANSLVAFDQQDVSRTQVLNQNLRIANREADVGARWLLQVPRQPLADLLR